VASLAGDCSVALNKSKRDICAHRVCTTSLVGGGWQISSVSVVLSKFFSLDTCDYRL